MCFSVYYSRDIDLFSCIFPALYIMFARGHLCFCLSYSLLLFYHLRWSCLLQNEEEIVCCLQSCQKSLLNVSLCFLRNPGANLLLIRLNRDQFLAV